MSRTLYRSLVGGLALLAAIVAGCSSGHAPSHHHPATHSTKPASGGGNGGIPQNNAQNATEVFLQWHAFF